MKLSPNTLAVLENFSSINNGLLFQAGDADGTKLISADGSKSFVAHTVIPETIPDEFYVANLSRLLNIIKLPNMDDADIVFNKHNLQIVGSSANMLFHHADTSIDMFAGTFVYNDLPAVVDPVYEASISSADLKNFFRATNVIGHEYYTLRVKDGKSYIVGSFNNSADGDTIASDDYTQCLGDSPLPDFERSYPLKYLKIILDDYTFSVINHTNSRGGVVQALIINSKSINLQYMAAPSKA